MQEFGGNSHISFADMGEDYSFAGVFPRDLAISHGLSYQKRHMALRLEDLLVKSTPVSSPIQAYRAKRTGGLFKALALATTAIIAISSFAPQASAVVWDGSDNTDFEDNGNWVGGAAPGAGDTATINIGTAGLPPPFNPFINLSSPTIGSLDVSGPAANLTINTTLTVNNDSTLSDGQIGGTGTLSTIGTYNQTGGTVSVENLRANTFDINSGNVNTILRTRSTQTQAFNVDIDGGTFNDGLGFISAQSNNNTIDINIAGATVNNTTAAAIDTNSGTADTTIVTSSELNTTNSTAISAQSSTGNIEVTANGDVAGTTGGVTANASGSGNVTISGSATYRATTGNFTAIDARSNSGNVTVNGTGGATGNGAGGAIQAIITTGAGNIRIERSGAIAGGAGGSTAVNLSHGGTGDIIVDGIGNVTSGSTGISALASGGGDINIATGGTVNGTNTTAISANTFGGGNAGTITVTTGGAMGNLADLGVGIQVNNNGGTGTVTVNAGHDINVNPAGGAAIDADSGSGLIDVNVTGGTITAGNAIDLDTSGTGNIDIDATGGAINGATTAIDTDTGSGNIDITINGATIGNTTDDTLNASTGGSGAVTISTATALTSTGGDAIQVDTVNGNVEITVDGDATGSTAGINAPTTGSGNVTIQGTGRIEGTGADGDGIIAQSNTGFVTISGTGETVAAGTGTAIDADITGGMQNITITRSGTITGGSGGGIDAVNAGTGNVSITGTGNATATGGTTIRGGSTGGGNIIISTGGTVNNTNPISTGIQGDTTGAGTVTIDLGGAIGNANAPRTGINTAAVNGTTTINADQNITAGNTAIDANGSGTGLIDLNISAGAINAPHAVDIDQTGTGSVDIDVTGGSVTATAGDGFNVQTTSGTIDLTNTAGASITAPATGDAIDFASNAGVMQTVDNSGTIIGHVNSDDGAMTFTNNAAGEWTPTIDDGGTHTSSFGTGTDRINNAGTIRIADTTAALNAAIVSFTGLENLTNTGTINLQNGGAALTTDRLTITPDGGQLLTFAGGGSINLDADLGGGGTADLVTIGSAASNNATATGTTTVNVNNTNPGGTGTVGERITVIRVADSGAGATDANSFNLAAPVVIGNVQYDLEFVDDDASGFDLFQLVGAPAVSATATQNSQVSAGAHTLFHEAVNAMVDRQGDTRDNIAEYGKSGGFWMHTFGSVADRTARGNAVSAGISTSQDTSYDQLTYGVYAGVDKAFKGITKENDYLMVGLYGGYLGSDVKFKANSSKINYSGATLGLYSTYIDNNFYLDTLVKADILGATFTDGPNNQSAKTDVLNLGGRIGFGYKMSGKDGTYFDPFGKLTYAHTSIDDYTIGTNNVSLNNAESLRGQLGSRFGKNLEENGTKYDVFVTASIIHDFDGKTDGTVNTSSITQDNDLTLVNLGLGVDVEMPMEGVNFFARANSDIGDDYFGYSGKFGFNIKL